jgi:glutamate dehydrogenase
LDDSNKTQAFRLESYRSQGTVSSSLSTQLRCYFIQKCQFVKPDPTPEEETNIRLISDKNFLEKATENTLEIYLNVIKQVLVRTGPVIEMFDVPNSREKRLVIGYKQKTTQSFFSALSDLYHFYELYSTRKYVGEYTFFACCMFFFCLKSNLSRVLMSCLYRSSEQFSNGVTIISLYLNQLPTSRAPPIEHSIYQVIKEASLIYCLPTTPLQSFFQTGQLSVQEAIYGYTGWIFAQHFLNRLGNEYSALLSILDKDNATHMEVLTKIKKRLRSDTFTREYILDIIKLYPELIKLCYINFAMIHYINPVESNDLRPSLSYQRLQTTPVMSDDELLEKIKKTVSNNHEYMVSHTTSNCVAFGSNLTDCTCLIDLRILPDVQQARPQNQLLPTNEGCPLLPHGPKLPPRHRVPSTSVRYVFRHWFRIPWLPLALP